MSAPELAHPRRDPASDRLADACRRLQRELGAKHVSVWLLDGTRESLSVAASVARAHESLAGSARWLSVDTAEVPLLATLLGAGGAATAADVTRDGWLPAGMARDMGVTSATAAAISLDEPLGLLFVEPAYPDRLSDVQAAAAGMAVSAAVVAARREAHRRGSEAQLLLELTEAALAGKSLSDMLAIVCERLARRMGVSRASVHLVRGDGRVRPSMSRRADGQVDLEAWELFRHAPHPFALATEAVRTGRAVVAATSDHPLIVGWWQETFDIGASVAFPLGDAMQPVGALTVSTEGTMRLSADNLRLAAAAAAHLGGFIVRTRAEEEHALHLDVATAARRLLESTAAATRVIEAAAVVADVLRDVTRCRAVATWIVDDTGRVVSGGDPLAPPTGYDDVASWVAGVVAGGTTPRPAPVTDLQETPPLLVPLARAAGWRGVAVCAVPESGRWRSRDTAVVAALVDQVVLALDNTRLREAERRRTDELADLAARDPLTGLANRRSFLEHLDAAMHANGRVSVLFMDLDRFKETNDTHGHAAGDRILRIVGRTLASSVRAGDLVARLAGDEFTVLLRDTSDEEADALAERLAVAVRRAIVDATSGCPVSASVGVASAEAGSCTPAELMRRADAAMYDEKRRRRTPERAVVGGSSNVLPFDAARPRG